MAMRKRLNRLLPATEWQSYADLAVVTGGTLLTVIVVLFPLVNDSILRFGFGVVFLLFFPGYALISVLFPEAYVPADNTSDELEAETAGILPGRSYTGTGIDGVDRVALAFGTSIALVPLIGIVLSFTPWGIDLLPIVVAVSGFILCAVAVGGYRRWELPENRRFSVPYRAWIASGRARIFETDSRFDTLLTIALAVSVLLAFGSITYAVGSPPDGEQYSEFYLLAEDSTGELVADRYPTESSRESSHALFAVAQQHLESNAYEKAIVLAYVAVRRRLGQFLRVPDTVTHRELSALYTGTEHGQGEMVERITHEYERARYTVDAVDESTARRAVSAAERVLDEVDQSETESR